MNLPQTDLDYFYNFSVSILQGSYDYLQTSTKEEIEFWTPYLENSIVGLKDFKEGKFESDKIKVLTTYLEHCLKQVKNKPQELNSSNQENLELEKYKGILSEIKV